MVSGPAPQFDSTVQFVVELTPFFLEYLAGQQLVLDLNSARGWDYDTIGSASVSLRQVRGAAVVLAAIATADCYYYQFYHHSCHHCIMT